MSECSSGPVYPIPHLRHHTCGDNHQKRKSFSFLLLHTKSHYKSMRLTLSWTGMLVAGMLVTGTINTLLNKLQDMQCVEHCDDPDPSQRHYFEQPLWQTLNMFMGEALCVVVYAMSLHSKRRDPITPPPVPPKSPVPTQVPEQIESEGSETDPLLPSASSDPLTLPSATQPPMKGWANTWFWIPTLLDLTSTTLMNVGLIYISASVYQMLRGASVLFTGALSAMVLRRHHPLYRWIALLSVFAGVSIVGLSGSLHGSSPSSSSSASPSEVSLTSLMGVLMVIFAQLFTAAQFVIEEKIMSWYHVPPIKAVALEGLFGMATILTAMPLLHITLGVSGNYFDVVGGWYQIVASAGVLWSGVGILFSIALFNWFGLSVTQTVSATSRSTIDTCRTLLIWIISLMLGWESFQALQVVGFGVLLYGTLLFNDVVRPPLFCRPLNRDDAAVEEEETVIPPAQA